MNRKKSFHLKVENLFPFFYGWVIVFASLIIITIGIGSRLSFGVFLKTLSAEFGWTRAVTSGSYALSAVMFGIFSLIMGWLSDKYGARIVVMIGGLLTGSGLILCSRMTGLLEFYLYFGILVGIGVGPFWAPLTATVSKWFDAKRGLALGIVVSGTGMGTLVMSPIAGFLLSTYGWRKAYLILGVITWILVLLPALFLKSDPDRIGLLPYGSDRSKKGHLNNEPLSSTGPIDSIPHDWTLKEAVGTWTFWQISIAYTFWCLSIFIPMIHIVAFATDINISPSTATHILALIGGCSIFGRLLMGMVSDKAGRKKTLAFCLACNIAMMLLLLAATHIGYLWVFAVIFGFTYGGCVPQWAAMVSELFGLKAMGSIFGMILLFTLVGGAAGPITAGYIFDVTHSYFIAFLIGAITLSLALGFVLFIKPPVCRTRESLNQNLDPSG